MATTHEIWKPMTYLKGRSKKNYAISNFGKIASYDTDIKQLRILKIQHYDGFPRINIKLDGKNFAIFPYHAVGNCFIKKPSVEHNSIIHLDNNRFNNAVENLKWATLKEHRQYILKSPSFIKKKLRKVYTGNTARKLDEKKVIALKKEIWNKNRKITLSVLAKKYGIAEMNLYRIKTGKLWWHVRVEGEPMNDRYTAQQKIIELNKKDEAKEIVLKAKRLAAFNLVKKNAKIRVVRLNAEKKQREVVRNKKKKIKAAEAIVKNKILLERKKLASKRKAEKLAKSIKYKLLVSKRLLKASQNKKAVNTKPKNNAKTIKEPNFTLIKIKKKNSIKDSLSKKKKKKK